MCHLMRQLELLCDLSPDDAVFNTVCPAPADIMQESTCPDKLDVRLENEPGHPDCKVGNGGAVLYDVLAAPCVPEHQQAFFCGGIGIWVTVLFPHLCRSPGLLW